MSGEPEAPSIRAHWAGRYSAIQCVRALAVVGSACCRPVGSQDIAGCNSCLSAAGYYDSNLLCSGCPATTSHIASLDAEFGYNCHGFCEASGTGSGPVGSTIPVTGSVSNGLPSTPPPLRVTHPPPPAPHDAYGGTGGCSACYTPVVCGGITRCCKYPRKGDCSKAPKVCVLDPANAGASCESLHNTEANVIGAPAWRVPYIPPQKVWHNAHWCHGGWPKAYTSVNIRPKDCLLTPDKARSLRKIWRFKNMPWRQQMHVISTLLHVCTQQTFAWKIAHPKNHHRVGVVPS